MEQQPGIEIGATLRDTRKRLGLDIAAVEEETKIRIRYLRALESEDWEILPAPTYVRGFLRTYAEMLGLDGDALADEYRLRFEGQRPVPPVTRSESVLTGRDRDTSYGGGGQFDRGRVLMVGIGAIVALVVLLSLLGGGSDDGNAPSSGTVTEPNEKAGPTKKEKAEAKAAERKDSPKLTLEVVALSDVQAVCVTDSKGDQLFADQLFGAGQSEDFEGERLYGFDSGAGNLEITLEGDARREIVTEPISYEITGEGFTEVPYRGPGCGG